MKVEPVKLSTDALALIDAAGLHPSWGDLGRELDLLTIVCEKIPELFKEELAVTISELWFVTGFFWAQKVFLMPDAAEGCFWPV